ncbi:hypothetical protein NW841_11510 [Synechococcus sp. H60.3]|uniref:hypothetical protein n=1 Tax=unclassified Synechococcus TaxID=2626047 RepID=UPI0039C17E81
MQAGVDLTLDYRTYRIAALLSESFSLGALLGVSLKWQGEASSEDEPRAGVSRLSPEQIEQRYLVPRRK